MAKIEEEPFTYLCHEAIAMMSLQFYFLLIDLSI
jgi:hypothetical protein